MEMVSVYYFGVACFCMHDRDVNAAKNKSIMGLAQEVPLE
jgi:hypothetical protein